MKTKFNFQISGFLIALVLVSMFTGVFSYFFVGMQEEYNTTGENVFSEYEQAQEILIYTEEIENSTAVKQDTGLVDVIGGYFTAGYSALKTTLTSFKLFENILKTAVEGNLYFNFFADYLRTIILIAIFVGVLITVLVKMRI